MQNLWISVKRRLGGGCVMLAVFAGCASGSERAPSSSSNYLAMDLPVERFEELRRKIERDGGESLKSRGEAHITVITPPEYSILKDRVRMQEIEKIARDVSFLESEVEYLCVGRGQKKEGSRFLKTYYVVVNAPSLLKIRKRVQDLYESRGGTSSGGGIGHGTGDSKFIASNYYPHVTVGFTSRDLHEHEGIIKDANSCDPRWKF